MVLQGDASLPPTNDEQAREAFPLVFLLRLKHAKASLSHTVEAPTSTSVTVLTRILQINASSDDPVIMVRLPLAISPRISFHTRADVSDDPLMARCTQSHRNPERPC